MVVLALLLAVLIVPGISTGDENIPDSVKKAPSTHKQTNIVRVVESGDAAKLRDFCLDNEGRILALVGANAESQAVVIVESTSEEETPKSAVRRGIRRAARQDKLAAEVRVYDADGNQLEKWPVGFEGQAINVAPDGTVVLGGDGRVARFDAHGKKLHEAESPQMTFINEHPDEMRQRAQEQLESDKALYGDQVKQFEEQLKDLVESKKEKDEADEAKPDEAKPDDDNPFGTGNPEATLKAYIKTYQRQLAQLEKKTVDQVLNQVLARAKKAHSICASEKEVFVVCPALAGYGFGVWRTDERFENAKEIVKSLSGCCGQMDVQCCDDELYVAENSRHRVVRFDREGKQLGQFGKRDREGEGANFSGCCNPMNLCFPKSGAVYVAESNGVVKHFTPAGEYQGIIGIANVQPGCKNSAIAVTKDNARLFYIDIQKSQIIVLARQEEKASE